MHDRSEIEFETALPNGQTRWLGRLYAQFGGPLYAFCLRMTGDSDSARDAVHDAFLRAYEKRKDLRNEDAVRSWLFSIARNGILNRHRETKKLHALPDDDITDASSGILEGIVSRERSAIIEGALNGLLPAYREVLLLREYEMMSYAEIASITDSSESAVKSRLFKARKALARMLSRYKKDLIDDEASQS